MVDNEYKSPGDKYAELNETAMSVAQLVVRIDERLHNLAYQFEKLTNRLDAQDNASNQLATRVSVGEAAQEEAGRAVERVEAIVDTLRHVDARLRDVEGFSDRTADRGKRALDFVVKLAWVVVAAFVLWRLHLQPVPPP